MPKIPVAAYPWTTGAISMTVCHEEHAGVRVMVSERIQARLLGPLAIYAREDGKRWSVALVPADVRLVTLPNELEAAKVAEALYRRCKAALYLTSPEGVRAAAPVWLKDWLWSCQTKGRYLQPPL